MKAHVVRKTKRAKEAIKKGKEGVKHALKKGTGKVKALIKKPGTSDQLYLDTQLDRFVREAGADRAKSLFEDISEELYRRG